MANDETVIEEDDPISSSPTRITDPKLRFEAKKALVWTLVIGFVVLCIYMAQSLLLIFAAMVFAAMIDGGARQLERILPIGRNWRVAIVLLLGVLFFVWLGYFAGSQIADQSARLAVTLESQLERVFAWATENGIDLGVSDLRSLSGQLVSGVGTVTRAVSGILGGLTSMLLIMILGGYIAFEPRLYERGVAWMLPNERRQEFMLLTDRMGQTLRNLLGGRLFGMVVEGIFTWVMLYSYVFIGGQSVPMATLLALLTALLAFIPNIGALISGILMVLVGFSVSPEMGFYTIFVYFFVQTIDGYLLIPLIAKKTVDLAPALVLGAQLIMGVLFGILGLALADPIMAMIKIALERRSEQYDEAKARSKVREAKAKEKPEPA
jgi:predicted PurR-regulated permease PerM